jgi:hypothetical protein
MPHLPESARLWLERAEIDYIGPFIKAWASFNAWYREASGERRDIEALRYVRERPNPVRSSVKPLIRAAMSDALLDNDEAQRFMLLVRDLHVCLDRFHIEVTREGSVEQISFRSVYLKPGARLPQRSDDRGLRYCVEKRNGLWRSTVSSAVDEAQARALIEQEEFDIVGLQEHEQFARMSQHQRAKLLGLYRDCNPRPLVDLFGAGEERIAAGEIEFHCNDDQLFAAVIEVVYSMRNALLHGELQPHRDAFAAYEPAYRIVMLFLSALQA